MLNASLILNFVRIVAFHTMHALFDCAFLACEEVSFEFENWDAVALFICSISITTTILQGSEPLRRWWRKVLTFSLQNYGEELFDSVYGDSLVAAEKTRYLNTTSRYIQQEMDQYDEKYTIDIFWEKYTKLVYVTSIGIGVFMLFSPAGCWRLIYLFSFFPLLYLCVKFMLHKEKLKEKLAAFIENEDDIKRLISLQEHESYNIE